MSGDDDLSHLSLLELYREETRTQTQALSERLLALESGEPDSAALEACMRAAHSLKGAARIVGVPLGVDIAGRMEECFVAAQAGTIALTATHVDVLLAGVDLLVRVGDPQGQPVTQTEIDVFAAALTGADGAQTMQAVAAVPPPVPPSVVPYREHDGAANEPVGASAAVPPLAVSGGVPDPAQAGRVAGAGAMRRVRADTLNRLLSLSGESLVESRWLKPFAESMLRVKRAQRDAARSLDLMYEQFADDLDAGMLASMNEVRHMLNDLQRSLAERMDEFDRFERRSTHIAEQLYDEALQCRMRPFGDATRAYPRIVRDLARSLGKQVRFSIVGEGTQVDRDILDLLDAPLGHLLRNAIDHGVDSPDARRARGKPAEASVTLEARHSAGSLLVSVIDDGPGVDMDALRAAVVRQRLTDDETAARLSDPELLEFLLLPGFSMRDAVTDVSGRGVGMDVVQRNIQSLGGRVTVQSEPGRGTRWTMTLPLTLAVLDGMLVRVGAELYVIPLANILESTRPKAGDVHEVVGSGTVVFLRGDWLPLVRMADVFQLPNAERDPSRGIVVRVETDTAGVVGLVVDELLGQQQVVVKPIEQNFTHVRGVAATTILGNGRVCLILDLDDCVAMARDRRDASPDTAPALPPRAAA